jgi:hypothetical protein
LPDMDDVEIAAFDLGDDIPNSVAF